MPAISATAPGKLILLGEHSVVYNRPALAVPLTQIQARAVVLPLPLASAGEIQISAPGIQLFSRLVDLPETDPLGTAVRLAMQELGGTLPACQIKITSTIPVAAGLGSGAAVSAAILRAISIFAGKPFDNVVVNRLAFEVEKLYHGTPSGIDNTVVTYSRPVYFIRGQAPLPLKPGGPFNFVIADTGVPSATASVVGSVRKDWERDPARIESIFDQIARQVEIARRSIEDGQVDQLGTSMNNNQDLLENLGVSSPELDNLISAARKAGAAGAKLSGAGRGGNMVALVSPGKEKILMDALQTVGAVKVFTSTLNPAN